jgi:outer membrane protein TolC
MIFDRIRKSAFGGVCFYLFCAAISCGLISCTRHNYKGEADETVYKIIDQKWQEEFGTKANYKISDTEPLPDDIQIRREVPASGILTLPMAVAIATAHNREYHAQKEALYTLALDLRLTRHQFETQFLGGISGGYDRDRNDEALGIEANIGFNRLLSTGTQVSTKIAAAWLDVLTGNMRGGITSIFSTTITQPLIRGSDSRVVLENLTQAERDALYQVRSFNRFRKIFVVSVISQYYLVLQLFEKIEIAQDNYDAIVQLYDKTEKLVNAARLPKIELDRIGQEKLQALDLYIQVKKEYEQALDEFKITLALPASSEFQLDYNELETLKARERTYSEFSDAEVVETALFHRLDLANSADAIIDAQRKVYVAADSLRADASLTGAVDVAASGRGNRQTLKQQENYKLDFELNLPLDRVAEQNIYRKALITLNQRQREYDLLSDTIKLEIRKAHRDLIESAQRYDVLSEGLRLAQKRLDDALLLLQYGRVSTRRVLDAQKDLFNARNAVIEALINYNIATLNFYRDAEILQVRADGMWEKGPIFPLPLTGESKQEGG